MNAARAVDLPRVVCLIQDPAVRAAISRTLDEGGCRIESARSAAPPHAVFVDRTEDVASARALFGAPVFAVGTFDSADEIENALLAGADDYVPLHISPEALAARLVARSEGPADVLTFENVTLYRRERILRRGSRRIRLSALENRLLESFMARPYTCHTIDELIATIWRGTSVKPGTVHTFVCFLRRKLNAGGESDLIESVRGLGYRFRATFPVRT